MGRLALGITVAGAFVTLYFTLFPFDVVDQGRSASEIVRRFSLGTGSPWAPRQVPLNILLTIPFGFGLGGLIRRRTSSTSTVLLASATGALVLSFGIELVQSAWLLRDPSVDDIVANAVGGAAGAWLWTRCESSLRAMCAETSSPRRSAWRRVLPILALLPAVVLSALAIVQRTDSELSGWDRRFPLVLGNEPTGDRPWRGSIGRFSLADRALSGDEIAGLLDGARMSQIAPRSTLVDHDFRDEPAVPTGWRLHTLHEPSAGAFSGNGLELGPQRWMQTDEPADRISRRIDAADAFTVLVDATTASSTQTGPARLFSISGGPHHANLTIGQEGLDLVVRVRTAFTGNNGISPEYVLPDVFRNDASRRVVITYGASGLSATVDRMADTSSIDLLPETVPLVATFTDEIRLLRFSALGNSIRQLVFATIMFAPWAVWTALAASPRRSGLGRTLALVIIPITVVEAVFAWALPDHSFRTGFVLTTAAAVLFIVFTLRRLARARLHGG